MSRLADPAYVQVIRQHVRLLFNNSPMAARLVAMPAEEGDFESTPDTIFLIENDTLFYNANRLRKLAQTYDGLVMIEKAIDRELERYAGADEVPNQGDNHG